MCILYDLSAKYKALVAGTGNRSELLVGYCTQYGDSACAFEPIGHLYKTEIFEMAKALDLPKSVIEKKPTADLWDGQTDEQELGITYAKLDKYLSLFQDDMKSLDELGITGAHREEAELVLNLIKKSEFKRNMPPILDRNNR